jgi:hypothetical protein
MRKALGIVNHHAAGFGGNGGEFLGDGAARAEERDVHSGKGILGQFLGQGSPGGRGMGAFCRSERAEASKVSCATGKLRFSRVLIISTADGAGGADDGNVGIRFHKRAVKYSSEIPRVNSDRLKFRFWFRWL